MPVVDAVIGEGAASAASHIEPAAGAGIAPPPPSVSSVMLDLSTCGWPSRISDLKKQTLELRERRQKVAKELKAAKRKNKTLKDRARCLSEDDMLQILMMKRARSTVGESSDGAGSSSSGSAASGAATPIAGGSASVGSDPTAPEMSVHADGEALEVRMDA